jgi:enoyl-CoA hydratase/carnithine racemase
MTNFVLSATEGRILTLTLNRPERKNALTHAMYAALADGLEQAGSDPAVRAVVFKAHGDAFTAGNDLGDFAAGMPEGELPVTRFLRALRDLDKPVIAGVNGTAVGVGLTMLLHCDLAFAAETASFRAPFAQIGLVPEAASSLLLPASVGIAWANDILIAGRTLSASEALAAGLVSRVVPREELDRLVADTSSSVAALAPSAVRGTKQLIRRHRASVEAQMEAESILFAAQLVSPEFHEAARAFAERRAPVFD